MASVFLSCRTASWHFIQETHFSSAVFYRYFMLQYTTVPFTAFAQNASIVWCDQTLEAAVIDPGGDLPTMTGEDCGELVATIRDFSQSHPDFEYVIAVDPGIVMPMLGGDGKPLSSWNGGQPLVMWDTSFPDDPKADPARIRGDIARTMLYMAQTYGFRLSDQDRKLYEAWNRQDPPDSFERERNRRIRALQGNANPFIGD